MSKSLRPRTYLPALAGWVLILLLLMWMAASDWAPEWFQFVLSALMILVALAAARWAVRLLVKTVD